MLDKFSEELRAARKKSGVTLQQIAQKSRIDLKFIEAIDRGDFGFMPELYVKAFIKQYAKNVGLDENVTINKYEIAAKGKAVDEVVADELTETKTGKTTTGKEKTSPKSISTVPVISSQDNFQKKDEAEPANFIERLKKDKRLLGGVISGIAVILFVIIYLLFLKSGSDIIVAEKPYDEVRKENQRRYINEYKPTSAEKPVTPPVVDSLSLVIQSADSSWFQIRIDNSQIMEFVLYPNTAKTIKAATGFKMIIGNTGDTRLKLNDKNLDLTGKKKEVKYVFIDKNGLKYLDNSPIF